MRRFLLSVARPAMVSRPLPPSSTSSLRLLATTTSPTTEKKGGKTNAPSTKDGDASRRTGDYGPADGDHKPLEQEGQGGRGGATGGDVGQRSGDSKKQGGASQQPKRTFATSAAGRKGGDAAGGGHEAPEGRQASQSDAAAKAKAGKDATHNSPTPTPHEAQNRKASGKSAVKGSTATEVHRKQEEYTQHRDQATAGETAVAADRAAHDPLPDKLKHSTKVNKQ